MFPSNAPRPFFLPFRPISSSSRRPAFRPVTRPTPVQRCPANKLVEYEMVCTKNLVVTGEPGHPESGPPRCRVVPRERGCLNGRKYPFLQQQLANNEPVAAVAPENPADGFTGFSPEVGPSSDFSSTDGFDTSTAFEFNVAPSPIQQQQQQQQQTVTGEDEVFLLHVDINQFSQFQGEDGEEIIQIV